MFEVAVLGRGFVDLVELSGSARSSASGYSVQAVVGEAGCPWWAVESYISVLL